MSSTLKRTLALVMAFMLCLGLLATGALADDEPYTVSVIIPNGTGLSLADEEEVEAAINEILVPKINCKIDLNMISFGQYQDQVNLMIAGGEEKMDLFLGMGFMFDLSYMASTGQIVPLEEYVDEFGQGIKDALGDYYAAGQNSDGHVYTIVGVRDMAYSNSLIMRKDVLDAAGINIDDINSIDDITEMCATIKETGAWDGPILDFTNNLYYYDSVGSNNFGVIIDYKNSLTVENLFESDAFRMYCDYAREWYLAGYIDPEAATSQDNSETKTANGIICGYIMSNKPGMAQQETQATGYEMVATDWGEVMTTTTNVNFVTWQVAHQSENPAAAIKVLNEMYSDPEVSNLICYGIEGKHYVFNEDGTVGYPEGVDETNTGWTFATNWMVGNEFLTYLWEGNDLDLWEQTEAFNKRANLPLAFGFTSNMADVSTEVAACQAVQDQYLNSLYTGELDVDSALEEMNAKLYASGLQDIIDAKQAQLDAWAEANGVSAD